MAIFYLICTLLIALFGCMFGRYIALTQIHQPQPEEIVVLQIISGFITCALFSILTCFLSSCSYGWIPYSGFLLSFFIGLYN